jgi:coniferyl-aldehyde dehydrogenase
MELKAPFERLQQQFLLEPYTPLAKRKKNLLALKTILKTEAEGLAQAVNTDFCHRARYETLLLEIFPLINAINYCLKHLKKWMKPQKRHVSWLFKPASAYLFAQPLGVVGIIVPWNYPILLAIEPLIYALAAGNRVMVKMSELTPSTGSLLERLINHSNLSSSITIINGDLSIAQAFPRLAFDHLFFTGSPSIGKLIMKEAAINLTPVTLELGGKSPVLLSKTMNMTYFNRLFMGKLANAGQTCVAPDYLLIPPGWENKIEEECRLFLEHHYLSLNETNDYSSIISSRHEDRLRGLLQDAEEKGARIVQFGQHDSGKRKMPFSLLFNVSTDMKVMKEEIFGPILPVITYSSLNEAIEIINAHAHPLVIYYFGENSKEIEELRKVTLSGALSINDTLTYLAIDDLPFGGVGQSGMGHYHGPEGFAAFSKLKPIFIQKRLSLVSWLYPPHGKLTKFFLQRIAGIRLKEKQ